MCTVNEPYYKKLLQEIHQQDISLSTVLEFREKHPNILWNKIIYPKTGDSILHVAARLGEVKIVSYILDNWPPLIVNIKNNDCKTPLHEAAQFSQPGVIELLINYKPQIDAIKRADWTPLMLACTKSGAQSLKVISNLLNVGASCTAKNKDGWTPLHLACRTGDIKIVKVLLNHCKNSLEMRTNNGRTVLHISSLHGNFDVVELLLDLKLPVNVTDKCGNTPLLDAVSSGNKKLVNLLINNGADINIVNNAGFGCLHIVAGVGLTDMIEFLIKDLKIDPNVLTASKVSPLHCAARNKRTDAMEILKNCGARTVKDVHNRTPDDYLNL